MYDRSCHHRTKFKVLLAATEKNAVRCYVSPLALSILPIDGLNRRDMIVNMGWNYIVSVFLAESFLNLLEERAPN